MKRISYKTRTVSFGQAELSRDGGKLRVHVDYRGAYGMGEKFDSLNQKGKRGFYFSRGRRGPRPRFCAMCKKNHTR